MKKFALMIATLGLAVAPALSGGGPGETSEAVRGTNEPLRGYATDFDPFNDNTSGASFLNFARENIIIGRGELSPGDLDYWGVNLSAGQSLLIVTTPLGNVPFSFNTPDTIVSVRNVGDAALAANDDAGNDSGFAAIRGSVLRFRAPAAGTYYIRVEGFNGNQTGPYAIAFADVTSSVADWSETFNDDLAFADVIPIAELGPSVGQAGTENPAVDFYSIDLNAGDIIIASGVPLANLPTDWSIPNLNLIVYATDGATILLQSVNDLGDNFPFTSFLNNGGATVRFRAPGAGRYHFLITEDVPSSSFYSLFLARVPSSFCPGDADGSGIVNFTDITTVLANFGNACP
jgi:hypothetical protein